MESFNTRWTIFSDLISCFVSLYTWKYDAALQASESNCPDSMFWENLFHSSLCYSAVLEHCRQNRFPILVSDSMGLLWIATPYYENNKLSRICLLGPCLISAQTEAAISQMMRERELSLSIRRNFIRHFQSLPVIPTKTFLFFGVMMHFSLTGEKIKISDILISQVPDKQVSPQNGGYTDTDIHAGGEYEALMLQLIEEGNMNYRSILSASLLSSGRVGVLAPENSLRQEKDLIISAITLCSRAAIRGGLSREQALSLSDRFIQELESVSTISEVYHIKRMMQEKFTQQVHNLRHLGETSYMVKKCLDIIEKKPHRGYPHHRYCRAGRLFGVLHLEVFQK